MRRRLALFALAVVVVAVAGFLAGVGKGRYDVWQRERAPDPAPASTSEGAPSD